jgi:hypothetical protein
MIIVASRKRHSLQVYYIDNDHQDDVSLIQSHPEPSRGLTLPGMHGNSSL